jgi:putative FmdB family regulatory protein
MPLYEYECRACGTRFEVLQRMGAGSSDVACPACGGNQVEKRYSTFASATSGAATPCGAPSASSCGSGGFS